MARQSGGFLGSATALSAVQPRTMVNPYGHPSPVVIHPSTWTKRPGPTLRLAIPVLVIGVLTLIMGAAAWGISGFGGLRNDRVLTTPGTEAITCDAGTYVVYQLTGSTMSGFAFSIAKNGFPTLIPSEVMVADADGHQLPPHEDENAETITRGSLIYTGAVTFAVHRAGRYVIEIAPPIRTEVIVAPSVAGLFFSHWPWLVTAGAGFLAGAVGSILLVVGLIRRRKASERAYRWPQSYPPPGGWAPPNDVPPPHLTG